ncbi:hypothetical protein BS78_10G120800 [Paspalum vaginatum]|nr:hypothetical protein BS78_10G120800 [Paspalum vaginatum]
MAEFDKSVSSTGEDQEAKYTSEEHETPTDGQQPDPKMPERQPRKLREATKWPEDKIVVTKVDMDGMPIHRKEKNGLHRLARLIDRQRLSLMMPTIKSLKREEKWKLFDNYITPHLEFPPDTKDLGFKKAMKLIAHSWRTHKSSLSSEKCIEDSVRYKELCGRNTENHGLGTTDYDGKFAKWEQEDLDFAAKGIQNPWHEFPEGRPRNWLRGRGKLRMLSDGTTQVVWNKEETTRISEETKEKAVQAKSSSVTWTRENDLLTACLGPKQPGLVWGFSSTMGWKHAWPECSSMYRKRRRSNAVDVEAITAQVTQEVTAKVTQEVSALLQAAGLLQLPSLLCRAPSPALGTPRTGRRSSCTSASEAECNNLKETTHESAEKNDAGQDVQAKPDSIDLLTEPTACSLLIVLAGHHIEVARGWVFPHQTVLHTTPLLEDHVVVQVEYVHSNFANYALPVPHNDELTTIAQALMHRIRLRTWVLVNPLPMDSISRPSRNSISKKDGADKKSCAKEVSDKNSYPKDVPDSANPQSKAAASNDISGATKRPMKDAIVSQLKIQQPMNPTTSIAPNKPKKVSSEKHQPSKGSKRPSATKSEAKKKTSGGSPWTKDNPKYMYGKPMLTRAELEVVGPSCADLHAYYVKKILLVGFNDLYDLFTLDAMDISLARCFTLSSVVDYVTKGLHIFAKKEYIKRQAKKLAHATKFPCHQQPPRNTCAFYTAHHMMVTMGLTNLQNEEEFEVLTSPIDKSVMCDI